MNASHEQCPRVVSPLLLRKNFLGDVGFFFKQKFLHLAFQLPDDCTAGPIAVKGTVEEYESRNAAGFEQVVEILHLHLWLSDVEREKAMFKAVSHSVNMHPLHVCLRAVGIRQQIRQMTHVIVVVYHLCTDLDQGAQVRADRDVWWNITVDDKAIW